MQKLVTIASYQTPVEAAIARNALEAAGVQAFLSNEELAGMAWMYSQAIGGVNLQVAEKDVDNATSVLETAISSSESESSGTAQPDVEESASGAWDNQDSDDESDSWELTSREQAAERAFRTAILGLIMFPLQLYTVWLVLDILFSSERLGLTYWTKTCVASLIAGIVLLTIVLLQSGSIGSQMYDPNWLLRNG